MAYTTIDKSTDYFNTVLYTGNGGSNAITGVNFQPDFIWCKARSIGYDHRSFNSISGTGKYDDPGNDGVQSSDANSITAFGTDGFTLGSEAGGNVNSQTFVSWNWRAGTSFSNDASATSIGTIDSSGSVSNDSGFSIVSYTGTGSAGTIKHGLSTAPNLFIIKRKDTGNDWRVGSSALTNFVKHVNLNTSAAESDLAAAFNSTAPTSSVFSVGTSVSTNASSGTFIAYCFAEKQGFSKMGSYEGSGDADGPLIYTGMSTAFVLLKEIDNSNNWMIFDNKRSPFNLRDDFISSDIADSETTGNANNRMDMLSNGFKIRGAGSATNRSGSTYIYMSFAESPFVSSGGTPTTAR